MHKLRFFLWAPSLFSFLILCMLSICLLTIFLVHACRLSLILIHLTFIDDCIAYRVENFRYHYSTLDAKLLNWPYNCQLVCPWTACEDGSGMYYFVNMKKTNIALHNIFTWSTNIALHNIFEKSEEISSFKIEIQLL